MNSCQDCKRSSSQEACPFRMADGRNFTNYSTRCSQLEQIRNANQMASSYDLRMFMTQNAEQLMAQNRMASAQDNSCTPCYGVNEAGTMLPEESLVVCNAKVCAVKPGAPGGLGQGRAGPNADRSAAYYPIEGVSNSGYDKFGQIF